MAYNHPVLCGLPGDSGGPLIVGDDPSFLVGITSFGNCIDDLPSVYTRISELFDWIESLGADESDVQEGGCPFRSTSPQPNKVRFYLQHICETNSDKNATSFVMCPTCFYKVTKDGII